ncbi:MAG: hypothetical protein GY853_09895 [PVC group bacterium]|nr:hypothetical protein [PVC group bacterium]
MSGNGNGSSGIETTRDYSSVFKSLITKLVDEKTIILEDFIRKNDLSPKEIVLENKEDIRNSTEVLTSIIQELITEVKMIGLNSVNDAQLLDRTVREAKERITDRFNFVIESSVNKELHSVKNVLEIFIKDLDKLDCLKELENLNILKKFEALEFLDKIQDLDKLKDLSYIEKLQQLDKLDNLDINYINEMLEGIFKNSSKLLDSSDKIENKISNSYNNVIEVVKNNREMITDKLILLEDKIVDSIKKHFHFHIVESESRIVSSIQESKFIEVFNKKELPDVVINKNKKAIVYGGITGSTLYKSNGKKWVEI